MKFNVLAIFLLLTIATHAQTWTPPLLPTTGKTITDFVPKGYIVTDSTKGDLNNDKQPDIAFILQSKDSFTEVQYDSSKFLTTQRVLAILFKTPNGYRLNLQHNTFILRLGEGEWSSDPNVAISIEDGLLNISYSFMESHPNYRFQFRDNAFYLVSMSDYHVFAGNQVDAWNYDFVAKIASRTTTTIIDESDSTEVKNQAPPQTSSKPFKVNALQKLTDLISPPDITLPEVDF